MTTTTSTLTLIIALSMSALSYQSHADEESIECNLFKSYASQLPSAQGKKLQASSTIKKQFQWENDKYYFFGENEDRHYTNGMKASWIYNPCKTKHHFLKNSFRDVLNLFGFKNRYIHTGALFGMSMFTPNSLVERARNLDDRPYAGWLYGGYSIRAFNNDSHQSQDNLEIQIGVIGPAAGQKHAQKFVHEYITPSSPEPLGWHNQISNRLGLNAIYLHRSNLYPFKKKNNCNTFTNSCLFRLVPHYGFSIGNVTNYINAGGYLIIGKSGADLPTTPSQPSMPAEVIQPSLIGITTDSESNKSQTNRFQKQKELYAFAGLDYRYYASNIFIEGAGSAKHDIDMIRGVHDLLVGFAYKPRKWNFKFSYQLISRSREFNSNNNSREKRHLIGQLNFEWGF